MPIKMNFVLFLKQIKAMAHRIYPYNIDSNTNQVFEGNLGEWNYLIPDLLLPLFSANPRAKGKSLYFDRVEGINRLRDFYTLLEETYLLQDSVEFVESVSIMFSFLDELPYDTFLLDASDVYTMNEEKPREQAKQWIEEIKEKWAHYQEALLHRNIALLDEVITASGYVSFLEALQHDWVNFGLGYWEEARKKTAIHIFQEGGFSGLKDKNGQVIVLPSYDAIYAFSEANVAVVEKEGKFGYLNEQGVLCVPLRYDAAFDAYFVKGIRVGLVCVGTKMGLLAIDTQQWCILPQYDEVEQVYEGFYHVRQKEQYQFMTYQGELLVEQASSFPFEREYPLKFFTRQEGTAKRKYYTATGQYMGEYPEEVIQDLPQGYYWIKPNTYLKKIVVIDPMGNEIATEIDQILVLSGYTTFVYKKEKTWHLFDCTAHTHRLTQLVLDKVHANYLCNYMPDTFVVQTAAGCGLYQASTATWLIELKQAYLKIEQLNQTFLRLIQKDGMRYYDYQNHLLSELYTYISEPLDFYTQRACLFQETSLYYLDAEGKRFAITNEQMGEYYEKRYNLRGKDLAFFTAFYEAWVKRMGDQYEAYFDVDTLYKRGCEARDQEEWELAIQYFELGAQHKDPRMWYELGVIYTDDHAWTDVTKGITYLEAAAQEDYADAWNMIGYLYQNEIGYLYDVDAMLAAYEKAVKLGCSWANAHLGDLYFYGQHLAQDYDKALPYYLLAEKYDGGQANNLIEIYYQRGDFKKVLHYLSRNKIQPYIHIYYGILYDHGYGVKQSEKKAIQHYEQALEHSSYFYAIERLLYYYKEHPVFQNTAAYQRIIAYAEVNEIEV